MGCAVAAVYSYLRGGSCRAFSPWNRREAGGSFAMCVAEGRSTATARKGIYALCLSAVVALSHEPAVLAQALGSKTLAANIPSESLSQALEDFAHQTDIQVVYLS